VLVGVPPLLVEGFGGQLSIALGLLQLELELPPQAPLVLVRRWPVSCCLRCLPLPPLLLLLLNSVPQRPKGRSYVDKRASLRHFHHRRHHRRTPRPLLSQLHFQAKRSFAHALHRLLARPQRLPKLRSLRGLLLLPGLRLPPKKLAVASSSSPCVGGVGGLLVVVLLHCLRRSEAAGTFSMGAGSGGRSGRGL